MRGSSERTPGTGTVPVMYRRPEVLMPNIVVHGEGHERPVQHATACCDDSRPCAEWHVHEGLGGEVHACVCGDCVDTRRGRRSRALLWRDSHNYIFTNPRNRKDEDARREEERGGDGDGDVIIWVVVERRANYHPFLARALEDVGISPASPLVELLSMWHVLHHWSAVVSIQASTVEHNFGLLDSTFDGSLIENIDFEFLCGVTDWSRSVLVPVGEDWAGRESYCALHSACHRGAGPQLQSSSLPLHSDTMTVGEGEFFNMSGVGVGAGHPQKWKEMGASRQEKSGGHAAARQDETRRGNIGQKGRPVAADEDENKRSDKRWKAVSVGRELRREIGRERDRKTTQGGRRAPWKLAKSQHTIFDFNREGLPLIVFTCNTRPPRCAFASCLALASRFQAAYSAANGPPVEPTVALCCPIKDGNHVIDNTVGEYGPRTGPNVVVLDAVHMAAGELGFVGQGVAGLMMLYPF
ncbi:hypothetical protein BC826DRAFT_975741 [Russula brevipes]|nr:hypothetical protein BC826DRAFT_975741 [Russula brevipes]